jgi:ubiquinone/menaquinone biosynthesis C-methylase UbiE
MYKIRDLFLPPRNILKEAEIKPGFHVLDYGCGPGSYSIAAAELVGTTGKVYALDINSLAIQQVKRSALRKRVTNIETIRSDCATGLENSSIDVVLLYDTFHTLRNPNSVLKELHRVLKLNGILSFSDHHMKENEIISKVTSRRLFRLLRKGKRTYSFLKEK